MEVSAKFEIFILFVWLDFEKDCQPNFEVFAKFSYFSLGLIFIRRERETDRDRDSERERERERESEGESVCVVTVIVIIGVYRESGWMVLCGGGCML